MTQADHASGPVILLEGVTKHYLMGEESVHALNGVDLSIRANDYVAVIGSSGSGKSTMMNIIGCLDRPTTGRYLLDGQDVTHLSENELADIRNRQIGFIFQSFNLIPRISALANVMQPLLYQGVRLADRRRRAADTLARVGLGARLGHLPNQLSGGQRQRVAVARALVTRPSILLADEPTGNLDSATTLELMALIDELHGEGQTIVVVTHEQDIANRCRRIVEMRDGNVIDDRSTVEQAPC